MASTLAHRGPDDEGLLVDPGGRVAFGHRRLAVVRPESARPPAHESADGRWVLSYNGEIYNFRVLRERLAREGMAFRGGSDTEWSSAPCRPGASSGRSMRSKGCSPSPCGTGTARSCISCGTASARNPCTPDGWVDDWHSPPSSRRSTPSRASLRPWTGARSPPSYATTASRRPGPCSRRREGAPRDLGDVPRVGATRLVAGRRTFWSAGRGDRRGEAGAPDRAGQGPDRPARGGPVRLGGGAHGGRRARRGVPVRWGRFECDRGADAAAAQRATGPHVSVGFADRAFDESQDAAAVADHLGTSTRPCGSPTGTPPRSSPPGRHLGRAVRRRVPDPRAARQPTRPHRG